MNNDLIKPILSIAIPTYNRSFKLDRLLNLLYNQLSVDELNNFVEIIISDNYSTDNTSEIIEKYRNKFKYFNSFVQKTNLGFDKNILTLYQFNQNRHIWYLADDDLPLLGSIKFICDTILNHDPDILLFSFAQPPTSKKGVFQFEEEVYITNNINQSIEFLLRWPKVSIYVFKSIKLNQNLLDIINFHTGDGWNHVVIGLTILLTNNTPKVAIISNILAKCDDDFDMLTWSPIAIEKSYRLALHPIIQKHNPNLLNELKLKSYLDTIQFCFAAKIGTLRVYNIKDYDLYIKNMPYKVYYLFKNYKSFFQFLLLKTKLTWLYTHKNITIKK